MEVDVNAVVDREPVGSSIAEEQEKMIPASRVNEIVKATKFEAAQKARKEVEAEYQQKMEQSQANQMSSAAQLPQGMGGMQQAPQAFDIDAIKSQVMDQLRAEQEKAQQDYQQRQYEEELARTAHSYFDKIDSALNTHPNLEAISKKFKPQAFPQLTTLLAKMDDMPDLLVDLTENPYKIAQIDFLARSNPELAMDELGKLSDSIKRNKQAVEGRSANEPLSRLKPSAVAGADSGKLSLNDYKRMYKA